MAKIITTNQAIVIKTYFDVRVVYFARQRNFCKRANQGNVMQYYYTERFLMIAVFLIAMEIIDVGRPMLQKTLKNFSMTNVIYTLK